MLEIESKEGDYTIRGDEGYIRVECVSEQLRWPDEQPELVQWSFCQPLWIIGEDQKMPEGLSLS